jgi:predicted transcriptional regulator
VVDRVQVPKTTVDRTLQELQMLGLLRVEHIRYGESGRVRWMYSLAPGIDRADLGRICSRNVSTATENAS